MVTLHFAEALLPAGWARDVRIAFDGRVLSSVEAGVAPGPGDERHAVGLPGVHNLHSHAFQRAMAGLSEVRGPDHDTFWTWREVMYRAALSMEPDDVEAVAAQLYVEMLETGFTRVGEFHYLHHDRDGRPYADPAELAGRIAAAAETTGIGLTLLPVFYAHGGFAGAPPTPGQRRFVTDVDGFAALLDRSRQIVAGLPGATLGVAPHSLRAVAPDELAEVTALAARGEPIHIHAAEQVREVEDCLAWSGRRPVEWLLANADVDRRWCLIHATHMTAGETAALAATGATAGLCPITEASLGDGIFPGPDFLAAGGRIGVGTDSNVLVDLAGEIRQLETSQRLARRERNVLAPRPGASTGRSLYEAVAAGGAAALGVASPGLQAGSPADLVSLDIAHPAFAGRHGDALLDSLVFAARAQPLDCVWAGGRKLVEAGRHRDRARIEVRFRRAITALADRSA